MAADMMSDKPTLVLLHGWGMNQGVWRSVTSQFEHKVSLLTPDLPGFGLSQQYPIPYQLNAVIELLAEQIPELQSLWWVQPSLIFARPSLGGVSQWDVDTTVPMGGSGVGEGAPRAQLARLDHHRRCGHGNDAP